MSRLGFLILSILNNSKAVNKFTAMTVQELKDAEELDYKDNTFYKQLRQFILDGLVGQGAKDGKSFTYYITEKGISELGGCHEE